MTIKVHIDMPGYSDIQKWLLRHVHPKDRKHNPRRIGQDVPLSYCGGKQTFLWDLKT